MNSVTAIARTGMHSAMQRIAVAAHNVAISPVEGARRQVVSQQTLADGGVEASIKQAPEPGASLVEGLTQDLVEQKVATYAFKANLRIVEVEQEMLGSLLDEKV